MTFSELYRYIKEGMRLPVSIYKDQVRLFPETPPKTASSIINNMDALASLKKRASQKETLQFLQNSFYENYILINIQKGFIILVGPVVMERIRRGAVLHLIKKKMVSSHKQSLLINYYLNLECISDRQFYFSGKLIEMMLTVQKPFLQEEEDNDDEGVNFTLDHNESEIRSFSHSPYFLEQEITKLVATGDTNGARNILNRINTHKRANLASSEIRSLKNSLICDCTFMTRAAINGGVNPEISFYHSDRFIRDIEAAIDFDTLEKLELRMIIEFTSLVKEYKKTQYSQTVRSTMDYIDSHIKDPITLTEIADALFINPSYLSGLFSKEKGITLSSYLKKSRIEASKWKLCYTDNSVANIALIYQFSSQSYFISCFKKLTGETPLQYRKKHLVV